MASIEVTIRTPAVPDHLFLDIPGASKGVKRSISSFTSEELEAVAFAWGEALVARSAAIRSLPPTPTTTEDAEDSE